MSLWSLPFGLAVLALVLGCGPRDCALPGENHLENVRKLTAGGENAEAYFSFDGRRLSFQATRGRFKCDQIFTINIKNPQPRLISTGRGRTTCAHYLPGDKTFVYSSTHGAGADCPAPPDRSRGYVWKLYSSFDIYLADATNGRILKRLTNTGTYDAEATVSPRGDRIVFTSMRDGDPELYSMKLDGSDQRRLTRARGYDGGAFYSFDGRRLVFRASRPRTPEQQRDYAELIGRGYVRPTVMEIYVMDADGTNLRQVTRLGRASFAPFFHPDGRRIIFSSNAMSKSRRNFDLYLINIDGSGLKRITYNQTFDGFPMFSRDGRRLVFASNRGNARRGETNVFIADWRE